MAEEWKGGPGLPSIISGLLLGQDPDRARKWMRYSWLAGFVWSAISFLGAVGALIAPIMAEAPTSELDLAQFIFAIVEVGLIAFLSFGLLQRRPTAAALLFGYFVLSRIALVIIGIISLADSEAYLRFLIQGVFALFFFQGLRGALTFYYLTHPRYPSASPRE